MTVFDEIFRAGAAPVCLAPMSGFTDIAFRGLCKEQGASVLVSEFVQSEPLIRSRERAWRDVAFPPSQRPAGIQIFGAVPESMAAAAQLLEARLRPDFIDLNFGCPARKVVEQNAGASLLRDLPQMERVARAVVEAVPATPISAKIRLGWDAKSIVACEAARRLEAVGVRVIAVHGRTRAQNYSGEADWEKIAQVVRAVRVPVVGNGDIFDASTALRRFSESGVAGVMVGRGALGNPWIFAEIRAALAGTKPPSRPSPQKIFATILRYAEALVAASRRSFPDDASAENIRPFLPRFFPFTKGVPAGKSVRAAMSRCATLGDLRAFCEAEIARCSKLSFPTDL